MDQPHGLRHPATIIVRCLGTSTSRIASHRSNDLAQVRPAFLAARAFQRTSHLPGEIGQLHWWHTGVMVPAGKEVNREVFGLELTLPHSGAHATVFTLGRTVGDLRPALLGCLRRLGGVPEKLVHDNDASIVASRKGGRARLHPEVSALR